MVANYRTRCWALLLVGCFLVDNVGAAADALAAIAPRHNPASALMASQALTDPFVNSLAPYVPSPKELEIQALTLAKRGLRQFWYFAWHHAARIESSRQKYIRVITAEARRRRIDATTLTRILEPLEAQDPDVLELVDALNVQMLLEIPSFFFSFNPWIVGGAAMYAAIHHGMSWQARDVILDSVVWILIRPIATLIVLWRSSMGGAKWRVAVLSGLPLPFGILIVPWLILQKSRALGLFILKERARAFLRVAIVILALIGASTVFYRQHRHHTFHRPKIVHKSTLKTRPASWSHPRPTTADARTLRTNV